MQYGVVHVQRRPHIEGNMRWRRSSGAERSETAEGEGKIEESARGRRRTASAQGLRRHATLKRGVMEMSKTASMLADLCATYARPRWSASKDGDDSTQ